MTAPASIPALIAEGRRLIAAATYDSAEPWQFERNEEPDEVYYRDGTFDVIGSGLLASAGYPENEARARLAVFAVNALPALLDVAEATDKVHDAMDAYRQAGGYHSYRALLDAHAALDSALSRLRGVR